MYLESTLLSVLVSSSSILFCFWLFLFLFSLLILYSVFLHVFCKSCLFCDSSSQFYFYPYDCSFLVYFMLHVDLTFWYWRCFRVLADDSLVVHSCTFVISDYLAIEPLLVDYDFCLALWFYLGFCTLCIWVPPSLSLPFTIYNTYCTSHHITCKYLTQLQTRFM